MSNIETREIIPTNNHAQIPIIHHFSVDLRVIVLALFVLYCSIITIVVVGKTLLVFRLFFC